MTYTDRIIVQQDWHDIVNKKIEEFWVQYKYSSAPAINGKLRIDQIDSTKLASSDGFAGKILNNKSILVTYKETSRKFIAPRTQYSIHQKPVVSIDVSNGGLAVSSSSDGKLVVWDVDTGKIRRNFEGHIEEINVCKFFPSGLVVVSGGFDMRIKIWSVEDGSCPVTLIGHTSGISDISIVERGKNIISVGRDGACKLWDLSKSNCISTVAKFNCIINSCDIQSNNNIASLSNNQYSDREVGTEGKIVSCACEDGFLRVIDIRAKNTIFELNCENASNCCSFLNENEIVTGTQDGYFLIWDLRNQYQARSSWKEFRSSVLSVKAFGKENAFIASTSDGSCFTWNLNSAYPINDFTGPNLDSIYKFALNDKYLFTGCKDSLIRKYELNHIL